MNVSFFGNKFCKYSAKIFIKIGYVKKCFKIVLKKMKFGKYLKQLSTDDDDDDATQKILNAALAVGVGFAISRATL